MPADRSDVDPPGRSEATFGPSIDQVVAARHFASRVVADAGLSHTIHDVALATGELAANAAEHAGTPFAVVVVLGPCVRIEVTDGSSEMPFKPDVDEYAERGRGMALVELVSERWGVDVTADGKRVWAEISY
jgi:anti-sigma regulatory factor (Ser/Thr protein kinase)